MSQTGYTPILIYGSTTTGNVPSAANLTTSASGVELAINAFDGKLFYKDSGGVVQVLATKGTGPIGGSNTQVQYNSSGALAGSANLTFDGTSLTLGGNPTLSAGTANGVAYLNGSKVLTTGSGLIFNGTNLGLGITPNSWGLSGGVALQTTAGSIAAASTTNFIVAQNAYYNGSWLYKDTGPASYYQQFSSTHTWTVAGPGTAGTAITFTDAMTLNSSGNLGVGTNSPAYRLDVSGTAGISGNVTLSGGTANGVAYLNGSKVVTTGSALTFDGTTTATPKIVTSATSGMAANWNAGSNDNQIFGQVTQSLNYFQYGVFTGGTAFLASGNNYPLTFYINGSEQMRLTSTGLGIGTSSPGQKLEVNGAALVNGSSGFLRVAVTGTPASGAAALQISVNSTNARTIRMENTLSGGHTYDIINGAGGVAGNLGIYDDTAGAYRLTLDSSGNLGLGVTPSAWSLGKAFEVGAGGNGLWTVGNSNIYLVSNTYYASSAYRYASTGLASAYEQENGVHKWRTAASGTAGNAITFTQAMTLDASGNLGLGATTTTGGRLVITQNNATQPAIYLPTDESTIQGPDTNTQIRMGSNLVLQSGNVTNISAKNASGYITFGTGSTPTERARIDSSGNLLVGTTSAVGQLTVSSAGLGASVRRTTAGGVAEFQNGSDAGYGIGFLNVSGGVAGSIYWTATTTTYATSSDYRLKENQALLTGSGAFIDALQPKTWTWKEDGSRGVGFIAHEVQAVSPGSVVGEKDAVDENGKPKYQAMEYGSAEFIANIVAEIQSLRQRLAAAGL